MTSVPGLLIALALIVAVPPAAAQSTGAATFTVYQGGKAIGTVQTWVTRVDTNWHIQSTSKVAGTLNVTFKQLELRYDSAWRGRFMTMEVEPLAPTLRQAQGRPEPRRGASGVEGKDRMIVHVSVGRNTTRTDIVRDKEARFQSHSVSPDTIFLPDGAFGAYEAVAARLGAVKPGMSLPLFNVPIAESRASIDAVADESIRTKGGVVAARRYTLIEIRPLDAARGRPQPTTVEVWVDRGRLLRLDVPAAELSIVRADVIRSAAP
jgi:hypothetical protein